VDEVEKGCWVSIDVLVKAYLAFAIKDTDVHFFGMKVDSAIKLVLFGVKSHMRLPPFYGIWFCDTLSLPSLGGGLK